MRHQGLESSQDRIRRKDPGRHFQPRRAGQLARVEKRGDDLERRPPRPQARGSRLGPALEALDAVDQEGGPPLAASVIVPVRGSITAESPPSSLRSGTLGGRPPYGFQRNADKLIEPDVEALPTVDRIYALSAAGRPIAGWQSRLAITRLEPPVWGAPSATQKHPGRPHDDDNDEAGGEHGTRGDHSVLLRSRTRI